VVVVAVVWCGLAETRVTSWSELTESLFSGEGCIMTMKRHSEMCPGGHFPLVLVLCPRPNARVR
jgi:hypothetical protein